MTNIVRGKQFAPVGCDTKNFFLSFEQGLQNQLDGK